MSGGAAARWRRGCLALLMGLAASALAFTAEAEPLPATGSVEVAFTPWDDAEGLVLRTLREARRTVQVQAYVLSSRTIANALLEAQQRGVAVRVLADQDMLERGDTSQVPSLAAAGIPVRVETRYNAAHNKVLLIDAESEQAAVVTGSYNFSWSAQARNSENLLVLRGNPALARAYAANWQRHWDEATPLGAEVAPVSNAAQAPRSAARPGTRASRRGTAAASPCPWLTVEERRLLGTECRH